MQQVSLDAEKHTAQPVLVLVLVAGSTDGEVPGALSRLLLPAPGIE